MRTAIAAFALGIWLCQQLPGLPPPAWLQAGTGASAAGFLGLLLYVRWRGRRSGPEAKAVACLLALVAGLLWACWRAEWRLADELPMEWEGRDLTVSGLVAELPQPLERGVRFVFEVEEADGPVPRRLQLSWYAPRTGDAPPPAVKAGERWRLRVRLKRPHGFSNPHGFDYEAWLLERGLRATGYVREGEAPVLLGEVEVAARPMVWVHRMREAIRERFAADLGDRPYRGVLVALAVGDQNAIPAAQWEVFRRTGVAHLVAISGQHISLVAVLAGGIAGWLWRRSRRLPLRWPARRAAAVAGFAAAVGYALLAGLGIPTQRAVVMLAVAAAALVAGRETAPSRILALALLAVLAVDPWAVLAAGFWLSFGAVAAILFVLGGRHGGEPGWRAAARSQLAISLATLPALLALFQAFSLVSPLANAFAIPLVSFVVVPLTLLAVVLPFAPLLELAHGATALMMEVLQWLSALPIAFRQQAAPPALLAAAGVAGVVWLLLPRGTPGRSAGVFAVVPLLAWSPPRPAAGEFDLTVLDVGHGLAVHIQTATRDLVYDTGPPYGPEADAGGRVVLPYLAAAGVGRLDRLVVSHDDTDHSGGAASLLAGMAVEEILSTLPATHPIFAAGAPPARPCRAGERWEWDGVRFEILHPTEEDTRRDNDRSCVVRISGAGGAALFAGDIEAGAEAEVLRRHGEALASTVMVVPHHGSRSSSTAAWVNAVRPTEAIFPVGYRNPFRHPHPVVWERWSASGARNWRTDSQGAITVRVGHGGVEASAHREREPRYWHGR